MDIKAQTSGTQESCEPVIKYLFCYVNLFTIIDKTFQRKITNAKPIKIISNNYQQQL